jgi:8-oxo-dGTP pyrophosphatase MutT (NUDIX family)
VTGGGTGGWRSRTPETPSPDGADDDRFPVVDSQVHYEGPMSTVRVDEVQMPGGSVATREVAHRPDAVAVVPMTADGEVVLVRQYRHPVRRYELEIPAGLLDVEGESEEETAQRELAEEIRMTAGRLERLTRFWNSAGWTNESTTVFVGHDLRPATPDDFVAQAEEADMAVLRVPLAEAVAKARNGEITDAKTVIGLLLVAGSGDRGA